MKRFYRHFLWTPVFLLTVFASGLGQSPFEQPEYKYSFLLGINGGGMVENSELKGLKGATGADAITGATKLQITVGVHRNFKILGQWFETGFDFLDFDHSIDYNLPSFHRHGSIRFSFQQIRLPIRYKLQIYNNQYTEKNVTVNFGLSFGYSLFKEEHSTGNMPHYSIRQTDWGPSLGLVIFPFSSTYLKNGGFFVDAYRGSQIFDDPFHKASGVGNNSYLKFGFIARY